ncbi:Spc97/Spc98 family protein [Xylariomycetidae sp. FL0641]|nr:Spc97/Spc98 family protein [Xylariomycetidae sp. FL0641]
MLHEVLLALSGHPSPLLRADHADASAAALLSPPERQLLSTAAHLSDLHCKLLSYTAQISNSHPSAICRAVSTAITAVHLHAFQSKILEVEDSILRKDAALVGAYNIVPLTAVVGEFSGWTRRLEWLWDLVKFMFHDGGKKTCRAAEVIDRLRDELQTGYADIGETALELVKVAESAWLKQLSAWVLYGKIPILAEHDFFIHKTDGTEQEYSIDRGLLPSFVTPSAASSILFIGTSLNRVRVRGGADTNNGIDHIPSQLQELARLAFPLSSAMFARAISAIRLTLSRTTLQKLLPLVRVLELLKVLREFFLLGRGEFAMALTQQADETIRSRWRRADNLGYEKRDALGTAVAKEGEVAAVLARTWAVLASMQGQHAEEDELLEMARELLRLNLSTASQPSGKDPGGASSNREVQAIASTPFQNLLFSAPVVLSMQIPSPLDLFLTPSDLQIYTLINSYLLSIRRAHLRLTDLWKITSLRRHHPPPPRPPYGNTKHGIARTKLLRERWSSRSSTMRTMWSTSSAAIFFLAETEAYLQVEVVEGLWDDFHGWLTGQHDIARRHHTGKTTLSDIVSGAHHGTGPKQSSELHTGHAISSATPPPSNRDPQTLATAHRLFLRHLARRLLLTRRGFTDALYTLLQQADRLAAAAQRLHAAWASADLETDEGVVDAFADPAAEQAAAEKALRDAQGRVKFAVQDTVAQLRELSLDVGFAAEMEELGVLGDEGDDAEEGGYRPRRVGGVDRLLMKLDFGGWFEKDGEMEL